ncbi:MAG: hypothetical protein GY809_10675 [Planctomycetes bacterium]|nr:hypothetical protein [Planctomycetota bacterium]
MLQNGSHQNLAATTVRDTEGMYCAKFAAVTKVITRMTTIKRKWPLP